MTKRTRECCRTKQAKLKMVGNMPSNREAVLIPFNLAISWNFVPHVKVNFSPTLNRNNSLQYWRV